MEKIKMTGHVTGEETETYLKIDLHRNTELLWNNKMMLSLWEEEYMGQQIRLKLQKCLEMQLGMLF